MNAADAKVRCTDILGMIGSTPLVVARKCADGTYKAVKCGREWRINKARFLEAVGLA